MSEERKLIPIFSKKQESELLALRRMQQEFYKEMVISAGINKAKVKKKK